MVGLLSPCMDDYLYVCDFKEDYYQISPNAVKRFCLPADHFHNVVEMHRQVVYPDDLDLLKRLCGESPLVAEHAEWAMERILHRHAAGGCPGGAEDEK